METLPHCFWPPAQPPLLPQAEKEGSWWGEAKKEAHRFLWSLSIIVSRRKHIYIYMASKSFIVSIWSRAWEWSLQGVKKLPSGCKEGLQADALMLGGSSKAAGPQRLLVLLEGKTFQEILAQPSLGASQPVEVGQVVTHLLDEFHLLI